MTHNIDTHRKECLVNPMAPALTPYHAKYYAYDLTRRAASGMDRLSMALFDASVDLNPHQIEAALFALQNPLSKGVILADEVGLGKTIEAGIVLCQYWAERRRRLLVLCPASLRKQWALELQDKFNLPSVVLDAKAVKKARREARDPLNQGAVLILSYNFANSIREELRAIRWDLVVIDEAHKLRNAYRPSNKVGPGYPLGHRGLPQAVAHGHSPAELLAGTLWLVNIDRRTHLRRRRLLPRPVCQRR